ncbi:MAG: glutaredoxin family protein [Tissierellaceae bacterium]|nr:glutaredoxin family protein [Tissierellaceae bacterium]
MKNVVVYTSNTCPYCTLAKNYLDERGVSYTEKNVQTDKTARQELMGMGHMGVPVLVIDGEEIVGFDKDKIESALGE